MSDILGAKQQFDGAVHGNRHGGKDDVVLAGGTDLIVNARERTRDVDVLVDIKAIPETMAIEFDADAGLTIGAATPCYQLYNNAQIQEAYPAIVDCASLIGGTAIVAPTGEIVAQALSEDDEVVTYNCDLELGADIKENIFNFAKHRRIEHYGPITEQTEAEPPG